MAQFLYPNVGALKIAATIKTFLATSTVHTYKAPVTLGPGTTVADLTAQESGYDGYAAKTVTAWQTPYLDAAGGASISSGYLQWDYGPAGTPPVKENVYGFWLEDAGGDLLVAGSFDSPVSMQEIGDSLPLTITLNYGRSA